MNTSNAAGYLAGALTAARLVDRFGPSAAVRWGTLACIASLTLSALSGDLAVLCLARLMAGFGAALAFIAGGTLAATIAQSRPARASFLLSLFYAGPGVGILASGLVAPFLLRGFGPGSWWIVWLALALLSTVFAAPLMLTALENRSIAAAGVSVRFSFRPALIYLVGYFMFGAGYIAYMTFMIVYVRDAGGSAPAQSAFWCLIGLSCFASPWVWRAVLARGRGGGATAIIIGVSVVGAIMPLFGRSALLLAGSALLFGVAFFAVVGSTTAFVRSNYPPAIWPRAIAAMTIAFGMGQTLGPFVVGMISDVTGSLSYALSISAVTLALAATLAALQRPLVQAPSP